MFLFFLENTKTGEVFSYGETPYQNIPFDRFAAYIDQGNRLPCPVGCRDHIYGFLLKCWNRDPDERPVAESCSEFFKLLLPGHAQVRDIGKLVNSDHSYVNFK